MFCAGEEEWRNVQPADKELQAWMRWRWARESQENNSSNHMGHLNE
jgi:hypothetical protein